MRRIVLAGLATAAVSLLTPGLASAAGESVVATGTANTPQGKLAVAVNVKRFFATASGTKANATATATLTPLGQTPATVTKNVTLAASRSGKCTILTLTLETLELKLLGLEVHLDKVVLTVTGERHGGVLGSLFCSLAAAKAKVARQAAVSHLNAAIRRTGAVRPISFTAGLRATTSAVGPTCPILNLVLGPLHLDLLGLVVDLNQVHLTVNAEPNGGVLGSLFCGLANTKIP
ncbi:MAG TPA: hypothetical protein VGN13_12145 [Solirubrobacteraceae bacterium]|jgi:hypothetical protein